MPVTEVPEIPEDAVDVTIEVNELKDKLHDVLRGEDVNVVSMAIGSVIGETFDDEDILRHIIHNVAHMAAVVFAAMNAAPEEGTIH